MKNCVFHIIALACCLCCNTHVNAKIAELKSPDGKISLVVSDDLSEDICLSVTYDGDVLMLPSAIGLDIDNTKSPHIKSIKKAKKAVSETIVSPFYRQKNFTTTYNEMTIDLDNAISIDLRVYNDGVAYRFSSSKKDDFIVNNELAKYHFPDGTKSWLSYSTNDKNPFAMAYQNIYVASDLSHAQTKLAFLPATFEYNNIKVTLTESDLRSYPGMFIKADSLESSVTGVFAPYPKSTDFYTWRHQEYVTATHPYIAKSTGTRTFPWRIFAITTDDKQMPVNNLVYALAEPNKIGDTSWIKCGKVAWDWWNDWGLKGVPFKAGINMDTYKYYIDFASKNKIEYVVLDEGWFDSKSNDMLTTIPEIDLPELISYGKKKNVDIILWTVFNILDSDLENLCRHYADMGIKGFKVDFLDRDDQTAVEMIYRIAEVAAKHKLVLDYHGIYKPTGLNRTYPNVINFEAVFGMEEVKWTNIENNMPLYDVTFPYIRLLAGPVDYTPGAMCNGTIHDWKAIYYNPMSMGTRCHQLATYIVYDSPFTMLCDAPTNYKGEEEMVEFIVDIPEVVDETRILSGKMGEYIVTARRAGNDWWIGALTNWDKREIDLNFSFLPDSEYTATIYSDGPNANKNAEDYTLTSLKVTNKSNLTIPLASGGGFAIRLSPKH